MKKTVLYSLLFLFYSCTNFGQLTLVSDLSKSLNEVSGNEMIHNSDLIWMINDSGNAPKVFGVSQKGEIEKVIKIKAKNHDWEDLTSDENGNLYIGDFGNNSGNRKKLTILKIANQDLLTQNNVEAEKITFKYPALKAKKKNYDAEAFFFHQNYFYIFTKTRQKKGGKTFLFRIPNVIGEHEAEFISEYIFCEDSSCRITGADISKDGKKVVLLNHKSILVLTNFIEDNFFYGAIEEKLFGHSSQKEGVCFIDENSVFITDEYSRYTKGNLYSLDLKN